ncbi:nicotinamide N-methyltransferase-like [Dendronephthya gigantea]|uniref:nicotinamide N-methyltransferase-like n=1 Tax=Dendronephthya gigantea TaxID=151771 RepID=UPI00106A6D61|nr:nicotinamide N-methyltransferase-like [Dendronephthya gigantea]
MAKLRFPEDYHDYFDPKIYLEYFKEYKRCENDEWSMLLFVDTFHEFWRNYKRPNDSVELRYLEYGGGPSIAHLIVACPYVDRIVFSEYTEPNRQAVRSWIAGEPDAHDWTPLIEIVVQELEQADESLKESFVALTDEEKIEAVHKRTKELKRKIKSIVACDVTKTPIVELEDEDVAEGFDVVSTSLCLESCVSSEEHYKSSVGELAKILKPNGVLYMGGVLEGSFYFVGEEMFNNFPMNEKMVKEAMEEAGLAIEKFIIFPQKDTEVCDAKFIFFTYGRKIM